MRTEDVARRVLDALLDVPRNPLFNGAVPWLDLRVHAGMWGPELEHAVDVLVHEGSATMHGDPPYGSVRLTVPGRAKAERRRARADDGPRRGSDLRPYAAGSPYGFDAVDWEYIAARKGDPSVIHVAFGHQYESSFYESGSLCKNVEEMFRAAASVRRESTSQPELAMEFKVLAGGYGAHMFNEIARDIIASDIAVFDISDLNPNVMIELGVALTWGIPVLPIREASSKEAPSDIAGQTWASYREDGRLFSAPSHADRVSSLIVRAAARKI